MISQNKRNMMVAAGAATLVVIGGVATFWGITNQQLHSQSLLLNELLPENTLMAISVTTDERQWTKLRQFGTPESQKLFDGKLVELRDRFLTANGYNYAEDMQPWVGREIAIGFLPPQGLSLTKEEKEKEQEPTPSQAAANLVQQPVVMLLPIANAARAKQFLASPKSVGQIKWVDRTYQGVEIKETVDRIPENFSITVIGGKYLAIANSSEAINRIIDTYKKGNSLRQQSGLKQALANLDQSRAFAQFYVNIPMAAAVTALQLEQSVNPQSLAAVQQQQGIATNIILEQEGIRFQSIAWLKPDSERKYLVPKPVDNILNRLPSETSMVVSGANLQQLWQDYTKGIQTNPLVTLKPDWLTTAIKSTTKLDLEKDLLSWMAGPFALGLVPVSENNNASAFQAALVFMVKASDRRAAEAILTQLDQVMAEEYNFKVEPGKIGEQPVINWISEYGALHITHGWLDGDVAFLTFGAPLSATFVPKPSNPLGINPQFLQAFATELSPNNGQFFIDVERVINLNPPSWLRLPPAQKTMVNGILSIGVTAAVENTRSARYEIFVRLKNAGTPAPLPPAKTQ